MSLPTIIIRHARENLKKCSLKGLEGTSAFRFFTYPHCITRVNFPLQELENYILLDVEGEPLSKNDQDKGLLLVDATWRLAEKIVRCTPWLEGMQKRSIPSGFRTAYPRRQDDCIDPEAGLASIEALYIAHVVAGKQADFLLDNYYWKNEFLEKNLLQLTKIV